MVNRLDVFWREEAHVSVATSPPAQRIRAVEQLDDVAVEEAQLGGMVRCKVEKGVGVMRALQRVGEVEERGVSSEQATQMSPFTGKS